MLLWPSWFLYKLPIIGNGEVSVHRLMGYLKLLMPCGDRHSLATGFALCTGAMPKAPTERNTSRMCCRITRLASGNEGGTFNDATEI